MTPRTTAFHRIALHHVAGAAAIACGTLLAACGGGGSDGSGDTATPLSQSDATADAANASSTGSDAAIALDTIVDTTTAIAQSTAQPADAGAGADLMHALAAAPSAITNVSVNCAGGGTATITVTGGSAATQLDGQLDAGEHYSVSYAQCTGAAGLAQLNGSVEMDVTAADHTTSPSSVDVNLTVSHLQLSLPAGNATLDGTATLSRGVSTAGSTTTIASHVTVPDATLTTAFNARTGSFTLTDLDATRTVTTVGGVATGSQYDGHHTLSGTAWGRTFSMTVSTTGNVSFDANGALLSGAWTVVRPHATVATTIANGLVVLTVDDGNDGTIDHTWTFPAAQLAASAG